MAVIYNTEQRRIIPKWRSLKLAALNGELNPISKKQTPILITPNNYLPEQKKAFKENRNIPTAGDLLSSAYTLGIESDSLYVDVAKYIMDNANINTSLYKLAEKIITNKSFIENSQIIQDIDIHTIFDFEKYRSGIRKYKSYLKDEPKNPVGWIELGRLYTLVNLNEKAEKCIETALALDKNNRFIVRSASRFYHHLHHDDRALSIIKNSEFAASDPWLISADIAYSTILKRHSKQTKRALEYLNSKSVDNKTTTELASAIGTISFINKDYKDARKYFKQSVILPNDNSLAQYSWMSKDAHLEEIDISKFNIPLNFEVKTQALYNSRNFNEAFENALRWQNDEPYSTRPIRLASYISSTFLNDIKTSIELNRKGLEINPNDAGLFNNLVYELTMDGQVEEAYEKFIKHSLKEINHDENITLRATWGLILFRKGDFENGRKYYKEALSIAKKMDNNYLYSLGIANYAREEIRVANDRGMINDLMDQVIKACKDSKELDVALFYKNVLSDYEDFKRKNI